MSLTRESSISKILYGSCCPVSFWLMRLVFRFTPLSPPKLLDLKKELEDLDIFANFSSSDTRDVLINLKKMQRRQFIIFSDNLLGCNFWSFFSLGFSPVEGSFKNLSISVFASDGWKRYQMNEHLGRKVLQTEF